MSDARCSTSSPSAISPADEVVALASSRSLGTEVSYGDKTLVVKNLEITIFRHRHLPDVGRRRRLQEVVPEDRPAGCVVIDNSSAWRYDSEVPLIVPEVNPDAVAGFRKKNIIANPNCSTAQLVVALKPLHDRAKIKRVVVSTYQSVSGAGKDGMDELFNQTRAVFVADPIENKKFTKRIAFNVIPHIDVFMEDGYTKEEWKVLAETKKMLDPASRSPAPPCACLFSSAIRNRSISSSKTRSPPTKRAKSCAKRRVAWSSTSMRTAVT